MLAEQLRQMGVVGAGGAGFPTYVKAQAQVEYVLANGAECEPLLHKDFELMRHFPEGIIRGVELMVEATRARHAKISIKAKNQPAIDAIRPYAERAGVEILPLGDFYPSGDEYELVYLATGRLIPPAGIPLQVGCVVNNVETLYNVWRAHQGEPVTRKFLSVCGEVRSPKSLWVPVGTSLREVIELAGGATVDEFGVFVSGIMMGRLTFDLDEPVTKTTAGLIVLPKDHYLVVRKSRSEASMHRIGKSACDQCSYCTEFCPRYLLGYDVQPHKVMRSLGFSLAGTALWNQFAQLCCACGLCTLYACPEDLYPKEACDKAKAEMKAAGQRYIQQREPQVHPMKEARRVPQAALRKRLRIERYETETPYDPVDYRPARVRLLLSQHVGQPAGPVVSVGDRVRAGQVVADVPAGQLGVPVHASIDGVVTQVTGQHIEIQAG